MSKKIIQRTTTGVLALAVTAGASIAPAYAAPSTTDAPDNVIVMIGDGMGWNHLYSTQNKHNVKLEMLEKTEYYLANLNSTCKIKKEIRKIIEKDFSHRAGALAMINFAVEKNF